MDLPVRPQPPPLSIPSRRKSVFVEVGLTDEETVRLQRSPTPTVPLDLASSRRPLRRPTRTVRFSSSQEVIGHDDQVERTPVSDRWEDEVTSDDESEEHIPSTMLSSVERSQMLPRPLLRLGMLAVILALLLPVLQSSSLHGLGVRGRAVPLDYIDSGLVKREDTPTEICKRWSHQTAIVNGTLYIYGGRRSTDAQQTSNTWTNDFLAIDLTKSWQISSPSITGLPRPSGPPAVSNGYLWNSHSSLYLYGGEFSDDPETRPGPASMWEYNIASKQWIEHQNPQTSSGVNAVGGGQPVQRAAEGAGFGVSTLGRGWYFGGHLDFLTTQGWSNQIGRVYLKSLVEFTFPGFSNDAVDDLKGGKRASDGGVWRNITEGGLQETAGFTERADGILVYIPGFGEEGILLGLTGGTNATFTQMNVIDVYDIAESKWYKQSTTGKMPEYRVNPCAVVAAAADGSSYNIYMFGGQNLQPYKNQTQYDDMWILSIPSFTWIPVDTSKQSVPYARAGHSCNVWDGQLIVVGGYVGQELSCDSPGIYVFNMSSLTWSTQFTALTGQAATQAFSGDAKDGGNPLGQQANQRGFNKSAGLEGSYGYAVPDAVQSVIGGKATGGATLTAPVATPTAGGPFSTGKPITYTVTGPNGGIVTQTALPGDPRLSNNGKSGPNIGAIVAGVIAGVCAIIAAYFAFCAWIYRKQVKLWKQHAVMAARAQRSLDEKDGAMQLPGSSSGAAAAATAAGFSSSAKNSSDRRPDLLLFPSTTEGSTSAGGGGGGVPRRSAESDASDSSTEDLLAGQEPTFWGTRGVLLNPRRSLRVINRD